MDMDDFISQLHIEIPPLMGDLSNAALYLGREGNGLAIAAMPWGHTNGATVTLLNTGF